MAICSLAKTPRADPAWRFGLGRPPEDDGGGPGFAAAAFPGRVAGDENSHWPFCTSTCTLLGVTALPPPPFCELSATLVVGERGADGVSADGRATLDVVRLGASEAVSLSS